MATPATLTALFGSAATQDANVITIAKNDLVSTGLQLSSNLPAERIFAAILLKAQAGQDTSTDSYMQILAQDQFLISRGGNQCRRFRYTVDFYVQEAAAILDPDNVL
jgi:hypothetical protein